MAKLNPSIPLGSGWVPDRDDSDTLGVARSLRQKTKYVASHPLAPNRLETSHQREE